MRIAIPADANPTAVADGRLITLLIKAKIARDALLKGGAPSERTELHHMTRLARLAYLAPDVIAAILDGVQPSSLSARRLLRISNLPLDWNEQRQLLGFATAT